MTISSTKELSRLIDLCRKKGIESIEIDNIKLKLGRVETKYKETPDLKPLPELSDEDILFWSSGPLDGVG